LYQEDESHEASQVGAVGDLQGLLAIKQEQHWDEYMAGISAEFVPRVTL
jgi:hypothetical protein